MFVDFTIDKRAILGKMHHGAYLGLKNIFWIEAASFIGAGMVLIILARVASLKKEVAR